MNFHKMSMILVIFLAIMMIEKRVDGARVLTEDFEASSHIETYSSMYEQAKNSMASWLGMLASGPSPRGIGH